MDTLAHDAAALIEALGLAPCHFVGLSMGGFVGMRLAARRAHLICSLMLLETTAAAESPENITRYRVMALVARWLSVRLVAGKVMPIMFSAKFLNDPARAARRDEGQRLLLANDRLGTYRATVGVFSRRSVDDEIANIRVPTLIVVGDQDVATPPEHSRRLQERIPNSRLVVIPGAGHTSTMEEPAAVTAALTEFLAGQSAPSAILESAGRSL
jgi:pimeloyl-ACP methyl ester carboxylesterase